MHDVFIGAGVNGAKRIDGEFQPFLTIQGRNCIQSVVDAALRAKAVSRVFIWGDKKGLEQALGHLARDLRVNIVQERGNIVESIFAAYVYSLRSEEGLQNLLGMDGITDYVRLEAALLNHNKELVERRMFIFLSDTPFITPQEIDYLISNASERNADVIFGRTRELCFTEGLTNALSSFDFSRAVKNFYEYCMRGTRVSLIVNSFIMLRPFKISPKIWNTAAGVYDNRTIIAGNKKRMRAIKANMGLIIQALRYFRKQEGAPRRTYLTKTARAWYLAKAYVSIVQGKKGCKYRDLDRITEAVKALTDCDVGIVISPYFGSAFDIDNGYELEFARKCRKYLVNQQEPCKGYPV